MKILKAIFVAVMLMSSNAYALSESQEHVKNIAKQVGAENCIDGVCFTNTLQAIAWQESYYGLQKIGDNKRVQMYFKHNGKNVPVDKSETFEKDGSRYYWYAPIRNKYLKKVYSDTTSKPLHESSLGVFHIKLSTAKRVIKDMKLKKYYYLLDDDIELTWKLLDNPKFSAIIAVNYLKLNYKLAKKKGINSPWKYAVSKYNGGSNNVKYINFISEKIAELK